MTILEIIETAKDDGSEADWPQQAVWAVVGALRSYDQGEASTLEGDCKGMLGWIEHFGKPTPEAIQRFIDECPRLMEYEVPDDVLRQWVTSNEDEK